MGGKGGAGKMQVTQYSMSIHFGICAKVDALRRISYGEKTIWEGNATANTTLAINNLNLFGGDKKEGGVKGTVHVLLGGSTQVMPDELAARLGRGNGSNCPAYHGITSLFFVGFSYGASPPQDRFVKNPPAWIATNASYGGFVWTSNTPYLRDVWATVDRFPAQLDAATAKIPRLVPGSMPINSGGWEYQQLPYHADPGHTNLTPPTDGWLSEGVGPFDDNNLWDRDPDLSIFWIRKTVKIGGAGLKIKAAAENGCVLFINGKFVGASNQDNVPVGSNQQFPVVFPVKSGSTYEIVVKAYTESSSSDQAGNYLAVSVEGNAEYDANPAHIIYECLTDTEWGMGESPDNIDVNSFQQVAQTLYEEGFGLSMMWSAESSVEDFVNEVLGHINGVLYTNPRNGLFTLRLSRGDYDVDTLRVITPDHATMDAFTRKAWGETVNEMKVTWTNPDNEKQETVTLQDLGNIAMQGAVISNSVNYYGIRSPDLAMTVCARNLRSASAPLCACEMTMDRTAWDLAPMDVVKVTWPEYGLNELVMRVTSVDYGSIGQGQITASFVEDIFSLPSVSFELPPSSDWSNPADSPDTVTTAMVLPAPYFGLLAVAGEDASTVEEPDTYAVVLAASPGVGVASYDLSTQITTPSGDQEWTVTESARPFLGYGTLSASLAAEPESDLPELTIEPGMAVLPDVNYLMVFGGPSTPVEDIEFAMISAYDEDTSTYSLWRGILDTTPRAWPADTPVWYGPADDLWADPTKRIALSTAKYRLLTNSALGQLPVDDAPDLTAVVDARASKPLRPANVKVNDVAFGTVAPTSLVVDVTWSTRNRLLEDSQILKWDDASVEMEDKQNTTISCVRVSDGVVLGTATGLMGDSYSFDLLMMVQKTDGPVVLKVGSKRGDEYSWAAHGITIDTSSIDDTDWARTPPEIPQELPDITIIDGGDLDG